MMDVVPETTGKKQGGRFPKGQSGNPAGRPKGSRNKLSEDFVSAIADEFERYGAAALKKVRVKQPAMFLKLVADLVPKDMNIDHRVTFSDAFEQFIRERSKMAVAA